MQRTLRLGILQIGTGPDKKQNLKKVNEKINDLEEKVDIIVTPEYLMGLKNGELSEEILEKNSEPLDSHFVNSMKNMAKQNNVSILFTTYRKEEDIYNSSVFVDGLGKIRGVYDKIHLFDAFNHEESNFFSPGQELVVFEWKDIKIGLATCFDLRFPELFRIMGFREADIVLVPSGFYEGEYKNEQWGTLISCRAHENNLFVAGINQPKPHFVGRSMVASPLGYNVAQFGSEERVDTIEVEMSEIAEAKRRMPIKKLMRTDLYKRYDPYSKEF